MYCWSRTSWTCREDQPDEGVHCHHHPNSRRSCKSGGGSEPSLEGLQWAHIKVGGNRWRSWSWWKHESPRWGCHPSSTTGHQGRDQECGTGHCGIGSRSYAALSESSEWNTSIGNSGGTDRSCSRFGGIAITPSLGPVQDVWWSIHGWGT